MVEISPWETPGHIRNRYEIVRSEEDYFGAVTGGRSRLRIPVNLTIYESYYDTLDFYRYKDEYSFSDSVFLLNSRSLGDDHGYRKFNFWLRDLRRENRQIFIGEDYQDKHQLRNHVDWTRGGVNGEIRLEDIIYLDFSRLDRRRNFMPQEKRMVLRHDFLHPGRANKYLGYFTDRDRIRLDNHINSIQYGRLLERPRDIFQVVDRFSLNPPQGPDRCGKIRNQMGPTSLQISFVESPGFEGICDGFNLFPRHPSFPDSAMSRWTTPYVSIREALPKYWIQEHYYYLLGEFSETYGYGALNINEDSNNQSLWLINFDDIFSLRRSGNSLGIVLNEASIMDLDHFLRVAMHFNFALSLMINGSSKVLNFDLARVMDGGAILDLGEYGEDPFFSGISLSARLKSGSEKTFKLLGGSESLENYSVESSTLRTGKSMVDRMILDHEEIRDLFPSQLLSRDVISRYFYLLNGSGRRVRLGDDSLGKLNIRVDHDDVKGVARIQYLDFLDGEEKEVTLDNLMRLPLPDDFRGEEFSDIGVAIDALRVRLSGRVNKYFWDSVEFLPENGNELEDSLRYFLSIKHPNDGIRSTWESQLRGTYIPISKENNLALRQRFFSSTRALRERNLRGLFSTGEYAKSLGITLDDYNLQITRREPGMFVVLATLNVTRGDKIYKGRREHYFIELGGNPDHNDTGPAPSQDSLMGDDSGGNLVKYFLAGVGGVIAASSVSLLALNGIRMWRRE